jgi:hypothetical protein
MSILKLILEAIIDSRAFDIFLGAALAIGFAILLEYLRKPKLVQSIEPPINVAGNNQLSITTMRVVRVFVSAKSLPRGTRWMMRASASQCTAKVSFHHLDGQDVFDRSMPGRWSGSPEPVQVVNVQNGNPVAVLDPHKLLSPSRIDIAPGERETLDIAVRIDNDSDCYGWNNNAYIHQWRNPDWRLVAGRYLIKVTVTSAGQSWSQIFRLINDVPRTDFRLVPATYDDNANVRRHLNLP